MIGKPEWFERRKYSGWGITPKTWQGWTYIALVMIPFVIFQALPYWDTRTRIIVTCIWIMFILVDVTHIMITLKRDEREYKIEAIAERNAAWAMLGAIVLGLMYQLLTSGLDQQPHVDPFLAAALIAGVLAKGISNFVLERKAI
jgi:hypothetical protein